MAKNLVIVESPAKAKTISRFLGKDFKVLASMGHVRDLPKSKMGIEVDKDFKPSYLIPADKKKVIKQLKDEYKKAEHLWLATDEDREGEAIGWHLLKALKVDPEKVDVKRIVFHEITEGAIKTAMDEPRKIDMDVVDAQQARRVLDRLVGYELSPLLWKKIRYGLSAGRVQSVAVRLVVEREREIDAFEPEEYWKIIGTFEKEDEKMSKAERTFEAELQRFEGKKLTIGNEKESKKVLKDIAGVDYKISKVEEKQVKRNPAPPFITSTLQQEASRKLHFSVRKTMTVAQQLYEGIDVGSGEHGLITYMRTDSVNLSNVALSAAKKVIEKEYGKEYALDTPRRYKGKKGAQEAHEAIRPVDLSLKPEAVKQYLDKDQYKLYELIWKRTIACQMKQAILNKTAVDIAAGDTGYEFRATGQVIKFPGFMEVYMEGRDHGEEELKEGEHLLPALSEGEKVDLDKVESSQHFTKPPARYTEASLVKKLESEGIGRPSTYAPTIHTIIARNYIEKEAKALKPTDTAYVVTDLLVDHFANIVDYKFTAEMEDKLDKVEEGKEKWVPMIKEFYGPFHSTIEEKDKTLKKSDIVNEETDIGLSISPMVYWASCALDFDSATNITASHNPKEYNGIKTVTKGAHSICGDELQEILKLIQEEKFTTAETPGTNSQENIWPKYLEDLTKRISIKRKIKVVVDAGNGTAGAFAPEFLEKIGCEVIPLYCELDGTFPNHEANPEELENMKDLIEKVKETHADLGIGFDGDGDRVGIVDEKGQLYSSDFMLLLLARDLMTRIPNPKIVFDIKVSQAIINKMEELGAEPIMCKTGHSFIEKKMKELSAPLAGEVSGHLFFAENYYGFDDALLAAGKIVEILSIHTHPLSQMFNDLPKTFTTPEFKAHCPDEKKFEIVSALVTHFTSKYDCITIDGVRINFDENSWGAVRASNTSPNLTLRFESDTQERLDEIQKIMVEQLKLYPEVSLEWFNSS